MKGIEYPINKLKISEWDSRIEEKKTKKSKKAQEDFDRLVASIRVDGIRVPLMCAKQGNDVVVMAGRHRLRAAQLLGLKTVPIDIHEDVNTEVHRRRLTGVENLIRMNPDDRGKMLSRWLFSMYEAAGYNRQETMDGIMSINSYLSHPQRGRKTWNDLMAEQSSAITEDLNIKTGTRPNELRRDSKFIEICKDIPYHPKHQYQLMNVVFKNDPSVVAKADKVGLSSQKQIALTIEPLPEHPKIQKQLIDDIADLKPDEAKALIQDTASQLRTGRITKEGKTYIVDHQIKKEDAKVVEPLNVRILDINVAINKFLLQLTDKQIKNQNVYSPEMIRGTRNFRLEVLKTLDNRNLIFLENSLRLVKAVTDEMLSLIAKEYEALDRKKELMKK